jgi:hypothetical protein
MKKLSILIIMLVFSLSMSATISAKSKDYFVTEKNIGLSENEYFYLKEMGISDLEINTITLEEIKNYLSHNVISISEIYIKSETTYYLDNDGNKKIIDVKEVKISKQEADEVVKKEKERREKKLYSQSIVEENFFLSTTMVYSIPTVETNVRSMQTSTSFNSSTNQGFARVKVTWLTIPSDRLWDIISLYTTSDWDLDTYNTYDYISHQVVQRIDFVGKQIYGWQEYDTRNTPKFGDIVTKTIQYDEYDYGYYKQTADGGLILKQNLKNDEITVVDNSNYWTYDGYSYGYVVSNLELILEADFDKDTENYVWFYGYSQHQHTYSNINFDYIYLTPTKPYFSISLGAINYGTKYGIAIQNYVRCDSN